MSIFPTRILLATEGSKDAEFAATTAVALATVTGSELHVVTVAEEYPPYDAYRPLTVRSRQLAREVLDGQVRKVENLGYHPPYEEGARKLLDEQVGQIERAGGTVAESHLVMGRPSEVIIDLGEEIEAGLIVVGSRGLGGVPRQRAN